MTTAVGNVKKIRDKTQIANEMNRQFSEMGANLAEQLQSPNTNFNDYLPSPNPHHERFVLHTIEESNVGKLIEELDEGKGLGVDKTPPKLLKWGASVLVPVLTRLFNKCLLGEYTQKA